MFSGLLIIGVGSWMCMYLFIGWLVAQHATDKKLLYTVGWMFLPYIANALHEEPEFNGVEGFCKCTRRAHQDAGGKWCSVCGGKIKDKLWKRAGS